MRHYVRHIIMRLTCRFSCVLPPIVLGSVKQITVAMALVTIALVVFVFAATLRKYCGLMCGYASWPVLVTGLFVWWDLGYGTHCPLTSSAAELCRLSERH